MKRSITQCLFDYKIFFTDKLFPAKLSFPQYFAFSISSVFTNIYFAFKNNDEHVLNVCYYYFEILPAIIEQIYGKHCHIEIDLTKLEEMSNKFKEKKSKNDNIDNVLLETYLKDELSVINYRKALLEKSLEYHYCNNLNEFVNHLCDVNCCDKTREKDIEEYPSSDHYLLIGDGNNVNKEVFSERKGPKFWGPFYWHVFHTIAETACKDDEEKMINFIYVLPFTIPCIACSYNYIQKMPIFIELIEEYKKSKDKCLKALYDKVHRKVTYSK